MKRLLFGGCLLLASCVCPPLTYFDLPVPEGSPAIENGAPSPRAAVSPSAEAFSLPNFLFSGKLDGFSSLKEGSGLAFLPETDWVVTHNDSFSDSLLYVFHSGSDGRLQPLFALNPQGSAFNFDWEDVTAVGTGRVAVADSGNNWHFRRILPLYFFDVTGFQGDWKASGAAIPARSVKGLRRTARLPYPYDCEALFCRNGVLYFCSKERGGSRLFSLPVSDLALEEPLQSPPVASAAFRGSFQTQGKGELSLVTSADYNRTRRLLALLRYGGVDFFREKESAADLRVLSASDWERLGTVALPPGAWEGVCWMHSDTLLVSSESGDYRLYRFSHEKETPLSF